MYKKLFFYVCYFFHTSTCNIRVIKNVYLSALSVSCCLESPLKPFGRFSNAKALVFLAPEHLKMYMCTYNHFFIFVCGTRQTQLKYFTLWYWVQVLSLFRTYCWMHFVFQYSEELASDGDGVLFFFTNFCACFGCSAFLANLSYVFCHNTLHKNSAEVSQNLNIINAIIGLCKF